MCFLFSWQKVKEMLSNILRLNLLFENYSHYPCYHPKIIGQILKNKQKKCVCIHEIIWLITIKMKKKMKNRSHKYSINRPKGLFIWGETSHLVEIFFIWSLHEKMPHLSKETFYPSLHVCFYVHMLFSLFI